MPTSFNPAVLLKHIGLTATALLDKTDAAGAMQAAYKAAQADGLNLAAFKLCTKIRRMDPLEGQALLTQAIQYLHATDSAAVMQSDLFNLSPIAVPPDTQEDFLLGQVEIAGRMAGRAGGRSKSDHQYSAGSQEAVRWERGWKAGDEARFDEAGPVKVAAERRRPGPKPKPKLVTEPKPRGRPKGSPNKPKSGELDEFDASAATH